NGLTNIAWREANAFDLLRELDRRDERFDTIVLDPPAFAKTKDSLVRALAGYKEINLRAMRLLAHGGVLFTCSCSYHVGRAVFTDMLVDAARDAGRRLELLALTGAGKFETLGALAIVGFLAITCFELIRGAVNELLQGAHPVGVTDSQLAVLVLTLGVNVLIAWYENRRGRELKSELLVADAAHTRADVLITVGVLAGVLFARQGWWWIDPVVAIAVALVIVLVAYRILVRTVPVLVDQRALPTGEIRQT